MATADEVARKLADDDNDRKSGRQAHDLALAVLLACRGDYGDSIVALLGAVILLCGTHAESAEMFGIAVRTLELGRTSVARLRAQDEATATEVAARRARDAS